MTSQKFNALNQDLEDFKEYLDETLNDFKRGFRSYTKKIEEEKSKGFGGLFK